MAGKRVRFTGPRVHRIGAGEQVVFHGADGQEMPMVAVVLASPQGMPIVLANDQVDKELLMLGCLQALMMQRKAREQSPLAKAGFVVPPGVQMPGPAPEEPAEGEEAVECAQ